MHSIRSAHLRTRVALSALAVASTSSLAIAVVCDEESNTSRPREWSSSASATCGPLNLSRVVPHECLGLNKTACEENPLASSFSAENVGRPSWMRRTLASLKLSGLPVPRVVVKGDPAFRIDPRVLKQRQSNEIEMQNLVRGAIASEDKSAETLRALNDKCLEIVYGKGVTQESRQNFIHRYGCTGWTDEVLDTIIEMGKDRGVVEVGAGNGQWARALMEHYQKSASINEAPGKHRSKKKFEFVLAYDDKSELPLYFDKKSPIHKEFFYDKVRSCDSNFSDVLRRWECRGRILLLVYPPPGPMASNAIEQYVSAASKNDTIIYVGEGRGGANADDSLFDQLESGDWVLLKVLQVQVHGSLGDEKLFILKRRVPASQETTS